MLKPKNLTQEEYNDLLSNVGTLDYKFDYGGRIYQGVLSKVNIQSNFEDYIEVYISIEPYPTLGPTYNFMCFYWNKT